MIYINGRFLLQEITGVQRFSYELVKNLFLIRDDIIVIVPDGDIKYDITFIKDSNLKILNLGKGHLWEQTILPAYLKKIGSPLLINLCNTAPIFYTNQIVTHHDITYIRHPNSFSLGFRLFYKIAPKFFLKNSKAIITVSEFSKREIVSYYRVNEDKVNVIYNAVNENFDISTALDITLKDDDKYFLAVGSLAHHKNLNYLIEQFSTISQRYPVKLKIVGGSSRNLKSNTGDKNIQNIEFLGRVTEDELLDLYKNAFAFIFPSLYEGFGIPPLEAQACGCPVISSDMSVMPEVLSDSVLYFNPMVENDLADKIIYMLEHTSVANNLRVYGLNNVRRFSWKESSLQLSEMIDLSGK